MEDRLGKTKRFLNRLRLFFGTFAITLRLFFLGFVYLVLSLCVCGHGALACWQAWVLVLVLVLDAPGRAVMAAMGMATAARDSLVCTQV
jgi:hypothetical protein